MEMVRVTVDLDHPVRRSIMSYVMHIGGTDEDTYVLLYKFN